MHFSDDPHLGINLHVESFFNQHEHLSLHFKYVSMDSFKPYPDMSMSDGYE